VADSPLGVRVVSVEDASQAALADLRPDDIIVRVQQAEIRSIDEFAEISTALKGRASSAAVLVFRNGVPHELLLHLYSYPVLRGWGVEFIPDHDVRFAEAATGLAYWRRLGRGFAEAGRFPEALDAYLNGLHNDPADLDTALAASELASRVSQQQLASERLADGLTQLQQALAIQQRLFEHPLTPEQLASVRAQLQQTLRALSGVRARLEK